LTFLSRATPNWEAGILPLNYARKRYTINYRRSTHIVKPLQAEQPGRLTNGLLYAYDEGSFSRAADFQKAAPKSRGNIETFRHPRGARDANVGVRCNGSNVPRDDISTFYVN